MAQRRSKAYYRRKKKQQALIRLIIAAVILLAIIVAAVIIIVNVTKKKQPSGNKPQVTTAAAASQGESQTASDEEETEPVVKSASGPPSPKVVSTATFGATGDILLHNSVLNGANNGDDTFDFSASFSDVKPYWEALDYMIVNLEVPCGGDNDPTGYPTFDAPDEIVRDLKAAGVDMCLTATNHTYDVGSMGLKHTQEVLKDYGLDHVGTRLSENESYVLIKEINGIKFGFNCYTYDTREDPSDQKSLNGIPLSDESSKLVNSFCYSDLDSLYNSISSDLVQMKGEGCDVTVFFMHWGEEYTDDPNWYETEIAQKMADLGVDVIIGGHPHVIQEFDILKGAGGNTTYCLYSLGNAISSQRKEIMIPEEPRGYTEDGLVMEFSYKKLNNGKVKLCDVNILPTWVEVGNNGVYYVEPLDGVKGPSSWPTGSPDEAIASYNRTFGRIGDVYQDLRSSLGSLVITKEY